MTRFSKAEASSAEKYGFMPRASCSDRVAQIRDRGNRAPCLNPRNGAVPISLVDLAPRISARGPRDWESSGL